MGYTQDIVELENLYLSIRRKNSVFMLINKSKLNNRNKKNCFMESAG